MNKTDIQNRAARIKLLLMDCDGVLTDGRIWLLENGEDQKMFHTRDGFGIELLHRAGLQSGVITGRTSIALERRAQALGMLFIWQGSEDKRNAFADSLTEAALSSEEVAFIGDDLTDIPLLKLCGLAVAVADGAVETRSHAHYVTEARGGHGAVREVCELILKAQNKWSDVIAGYLK
jgi:3-deoxy-D-manno-octulosonate 8-phosphate phosphatase (KDO 8-P phosphatase)